MTVYKCKCVDCGKDFETSSYRSSKKSRCLECAYRRVQINAEELHKHSGPAYDKWRLAVKKAVGRL